MAYDTNSNDDENSNYLNVAYSWPLTDRAKRRCRLFRRQAFKCRQTICRCILVTFDSLSVSNAEYSWSLFERRFYIPSPVLHCDLATIYRCGTFNIVNMLLENLEFVLFNARQRRYKRSRTVLRRMQLTAATSISFPSAVQAFPGPMSCGNRKLRKSIFLDFWCYKLNLIFATDQHECRICTVDITSNLS